MISLKQVAQDLREKFPAVFSTARTHVRLHHLLLLAVFMLSGISFWFSYELRFDFQVPAFFQHRRLVLLPYVALLKLGAFYFIRGHSANWRYFGLRDLPTLVLHGVLCSVLILLLSTSFNELWVPRGVVVIDFLMTLALIGGVRIGLRVLRERASSLFFRRERADRVSAIVIGAGDAGEMVIREMLRNRDHKFDVKAVFDDDTSKQGWSIHGIRVEGGIEDIPLYLQEKPADVAVVAIPSATNAQMRRIYEVLKGLDLTVKTLPSLNEMMGDFPNLTQLREINITDLLGREEVKIDTEQVRSLISGKVVVVTGAGGSIGSEICRQVLKRDPKMLVMMERYENNLFHIHRKIAEIWPEKRVEPILCDVTDEVRMHYEFQKFRPDIVFHAAAHKHVALQEINPAECFRNNVGGIQALARAASRFEVERFVLISTDKAVNPTSVMGASKRVCEIYCQAFAHQSSTRFMAVRFGNVLASEGSVVPIFLEQIERGGPVTVTHPEMKRYFMTIPEAVTLVLQAAVLGNSGQIMILDMGAPVRIVDLVHQLIQLAGKKPEEAPIEFIGPRPGEKLFEELNRGEEVCIQTAHSKIKVFHQNGRIPPSAALAIDNALRETEPGMSGEEVRAILRRLVPEYLAEAETPSKHPGRDLADGNVSETAVMC